MTYAEALAQYHLRPESKFLNGDYRDRRRTERRHVAATEVNHIGKEANKWEERYFVGDVEEEDAEIKYGAAREAAILDECIMALSRQIGERKAAQGGRSAGDFADCAAASNEARQRRGLAIDKETRGIVPSMSRREGAENCQLMMRVGMSPTGEWGRLFAQMQISARWSTVLIRGCE